MRKLRVSIEQNDDAREKQVALMEFLSFRQWLLVSPANPNETLSLEHLWAWESMRCLQPLWSTRREAPDLVFLQETKLSASFFDYRKNLFGFDCVLFVDYNGRGGGLALLWQKDVDFELTKYSESSSMPVLKVHMGGFELEYTVVPK